MSTSAFSIGICSSFDEAIKLAEKKKKNSERGIRSDTLFLAEHVGKQCICPSIMSSVEPLTLRCHSMLSDQCVYTGTWGTDALQNLGCVLLAPALCDNRNVCF